MIHERNLEFKLFVIYNMRQVVLNETEVQHIQSCQNEVCFSYRM